MNTYNVTLTFEFSSIEAHDENEAREIANNLLDDEDWTDYRCQVQKIEEAAQ